MEKVVTGKVRFSFVNVFEARAMDGGEAKYSATLLIPKTDTQTYNKIINAMNKTLNDSISTIFGGVKPANPKFPIYDGDGLRPSGEPFGEECKGNWVITGNSKEKPEVVDFGLNPILSKSEFYSGCYGRASIVFYAYNRNGNKGIGCGLNNVQKLEDGKPLSGKSSASEDFADSVNQNTVVSQPINNNYGNTQVNPITGQPINNIYGVN